MTLRDIEKILLLGTGHKITAKMKSCHMVMKSFTPNWVGHRIFLARMMGYETDIPDILE